MVAGHLMVAILLVLFLVGEEQELKPAVVLTQPHSMEEHLALDHLLHLKVVTLTDALPQ